MIGKLFKATLFTIISLTICGCIFDRDTNSNEKYVPTSLRKSIAAPHLKGKINFDGRLDEKVWQNAGFFDDFVGYKKLTPPSSRTEVRVFHDDEYLYFGLKCFDKKEDIRPVNGNSSLWIGDCIELFLGNMEPEPYSYQFCWGSGKTRYGANEFWDSKSAVYDDYWTTETRIKLSLLKPHNAALAIHIARLGGKSRQYSIWNNIGIDFNNLPEYAELILGSYDLAAQTNFRYYSDRKLTRSEYEKLSAERTISPAAINCGPWLYAASETEMNIGWYTEGRTGAVLKYRKKGSSKFTSVILDKHGHLFDKDRRIHKVQLKNLSKSTEYEYFITNLCGKYTKRYPEDGSFYTFSTHGKKDLTIIALSDVHGDGYSFKSLMQNKKLMDKCDIIVNIGDMLSNSTGIRSIIHGYLAAQMPFASKKPLLNFRGNHEYAGCSPSTFFEVFGTPDFKGYSLNRFGDVCIIGLDCWNGKQRAWLEKAVKTPEFQTAKHRIMFAHFPPANADKAFTKTLLKDIDGIFAGKNPTERIDLLVAGHIHRGSYTPKNSTVTEYIDSTRNPGKPAKVPFAVVVNEGYRYSHKNVMTMIEAKGDSLTVKLISADGSVSREIKIK